MTVLRKNARVCKNCKVWQNEYSEKYDCKFNGPWGSCKEFESKYSKQKSEVSPCDDCDVVASPGCGNCLGV